MLRESSEYGGGLWWLLVIASIVSILFGVATLFMPGLTLVTLIVMFAAFILAHGIIELVHGFSAMKEDKLWWVQALLGALLLCAGVYLAKHPAITAVTFVVFAGWVLLAWGLYQIATGLFIARNKMRWIFPGILGVIGGVAIWIYPVRGALAFTWVLGLYALLSGVLTLSSAFTARAIRKKIIEESGSTSTNF